MRQSQPQPIDVAVEHHRAGRLAQAESIYRNILADAPHNTKAIHLLGLLAHQAGKHASAIELVDRALLAEPTRTDFLNTRGMALAAMGRRVEAIASYRQAIALRPGYAPALNNLGTVLMDQNDRPGALAAFEAALLAQPNFVECMTNLAGLHLEDQNWSQCISSCRQALELRPNDSRALTILAKALARSHRSREAIEIFLNIIRTHGDNAEIRFQLASAQTAAGDFAAGVSSYLQVVAAKPAWAPAWSNLGSAYLDLNQYEQAVNALKQAIALEPRSAGAHCNLGLAFNGLGQIDDAIEQQRLAVELDPSLVQSWANLAGALREAGQIRASMEAGRQAVARGGTAAMHSNLVYASHFNPDYDARAVLNEHLAWAQKHAAAIVRMQLGGIDRNPSRPLRIGLVSPDFRQHVVGWNLLPFLRHHDAQQYAIYCYSDVRHSDANTATIRAMSDHWRDTASLSDDRLASQIALDQIDILIDLTLHMANNRLLVFARKPAPVQATYLAYCGTTGLANVDFRLSDHQLDPPGTDLTVYTEQTVFLPVSYWCYEAPAVANDISFTRAPGLNFGCLNSYAKISDATLNLWGQVLTQTPRSGLILHAPPGSPRERMIAAFDKFDIDPARITFAGKQNWARYLATYHDIDVCLDPIPYGGGITSCDSLYMGTPVVSLSGNTAVGRGGRTILHNVGLDNLCAATAAEYVLLATQLIVDADRLNFMRKTLRDQMVASPLMDQKRFCDDLQNALRTMWMQYCKTA